MFGKGGGPLSSWIKEFCELVFIQTLQAFIFALTIGFIISIIQREMAMDPTDRNSALGIICIVALTSIFKIEDIARRIFGYGPTKADHGNAVASIGKSMLALRMGKNLLDNGKKIAGGAGAYFGAHKAKLKALDRRRRRYEALDKDNGSSDSDAATLNANSDSVALNSADPSKAQRKIDARKIEEKIRLTEQAQQSRKMAMKEKDEKKRKALIADAKGKLEMARSIDDTLREPQGTANVKSNSSSGGRIKDYNQKKMQIEDDFEEKMSEIEKKKREGFKTMVSGVAETGAAMVGFTAGTAMSAASNNDWGAAVKDGLTWAGTADAVTAGAVDLTHSVSEFTRNRAKGLSKIASEYGANARAAYDSYVNEIQKSDNEMTSQANQQMEEMKADVESAANKVTEQKLKTSTKVKGFGKALVQAAKPTFNNRSVTARTKEVNDYVKTLDAKNKPKAKDTEGHVFN